jgi:hypothetical protein
MKRFKGVWREHLKSATVYLGKFVGTLVTMNAGSGRGVWSAAVGDWRKGEAIPSAPLYYDGMVMAGLSGGEFGMRSSVSAGEKTNLQKSPVAEHLAQVEKRVRNGGGAMPPLSGVLSTEEIDAVAHDVVDQIAPKA